MKAKDVGMLCGPAEDVECFVVDYRNVSMQSERPAESTKDAKGSDDEGIPKRHLFNRTVMNLAQTSPNDSYSDFRVIRGFREQSFGILAA